MPVGATNVYELALCVSLGLNIVYGMKNSFPLPACHRPGTECRS